MRWFKNIRNVRIGGFIGLLILFLTGCDQIKTPIKPSLNTQPEHTLSRVLYGETFQLDPIFVTSSAYTAPLRDLLTGLMIFNNKGEVVSGVAENWQSEDGRTWVFYLKKNAKWSNNAPVTAQDFVLSWQRLANVQNHSPLSDYLIYMGIKNAEAVILGQKFATDLGIMAIDQHIIKIELNRVNFQLPLMLAHSALLPTYQGKAPNLEEGFISNGAYKLKKKEYNQLTLTATQSSIPFQKVIYNRINSFNALKNYDLIDNPSEEYSKNIVKLPKLCTSFYEFNFADPLMQRKPIRQAIKGMLSVNKVVEKEGIPNSSILPNSMYFNETNHWKPIVVEELLANENITSKNPLKITLTVDNQGNHYQIANNMVRSLCRSDLFTVDLKEVTWQDLLRIRERKQFQMIRSGWCADFPDPVQFLTHFHSKSPDNKMSYKNEIVDKLLEQLEGNNLDFAERQNLLYQVIQQLEDDVVILPLFQYQQNIALDPSIKGVESENSSGVIYSKDLYRVVSKSN
ncbi:Periplasmic oligopeptide-binding protein precursor [Phocoenobacter uteri]|uniref:Periplasmic oligopeptide-binding protein n=1 Tax=Phocoenobacter uteri TaxID=146806 RepID=A0A379C9F5_9PAST|nr:peptide ABC transporter substrate-binding protein [Phocoenobacter uteri]MDG6882725.1 hypothetical protein [Phocoenobacter uteri]SUB58891.1 Periplasmic oligopeptide-binding protein precursor [Phocoenobacter uteri]